MPPGDDTPPHTYDVIVVLGGPLGALRRRTAHAVGLLQAGKAGALLLTGRGRKPFVEAEVMAEQAVAAGIPARSIVVETQARSTWENAAFSARIMRARGWRSALVVTDRLHLPRALLAFWGTGVRARGSAAKGGWREEPFGTLLNDLCHEAVGFLWYCALLVRRRRG